MAELKTRRNDWDVGEFIASIPDEGQRRDSATLVELMTAVTGSAATMWGTNMVGFGSYHYRYASGHEGDWFVVGFAPRKKSLTLYIMDGFDGYRELLGRLGKHSTGKACLYIKRLDDVAVDVLAELVRRSVDAVRTSSS
ncbi:MAG: DUF1801 domain-containing protein [Pseudonocardiaceae bacterium]